MTTQHDYRVEHPNEWMAANPIDANAHSGQELVLPPRRSPEAAGRMSLVVIAIVAAGAALYVAKLIFIVTFVSLLLAFVLEPLTRQFERLRLPRPLAAFISVVLLFAVMYGLAYVSYNRAVGFTHELPRYIQEIKRVTGKFRRQAQSLQKSTQGVITDETNPPTVTIRQESDWTGTLFSSLGTATELVFAASFVPFLAYFMLTWKEHGRRCTVMLFPSDMRSTAYATLTAITDMVRGFIVGNFLVGLFIGVISTAIFGFLGLPYFYFIGFISGFLSLVPYLGVLVAAVPPLLAGIGQIRSSGLLIVLLTVLFLHLFALNVLYPKFLGSRLQLNPLAVTLALLFWGWIWGAIGLLLAIPVTAACKIVFDHIESLRPLGAWLGE